MSHTRLRLVSKSTTLDDLEGPLRTLDQKTCVFRSPPRRCSATTLDSGNIRIVRLFPGVPWTGGVKRQWGNQKRRFRTLRLRHLRKWGQHYYMPLFNPLSPFHWPQNTWPWMTLNGLKGNLRYMFTITNGHWLIICYWFTGVCLLHVMWPARSIANSDPQRGRIFGIRGISADRDLPWTGRYRRNLNNWRQHYYMVLVSALSPFHWLQNAWLWMTLNRHLR